MGAMKEPLLLIPGPTNISQKVRDVMAEPQLAHSGEEFREGFGELLRLARYVFRNEKGAQFVFAGSGTIAMESAAASLVSRGDSTLTLITGYFGRRMAEVNEAHGAKADEVVFDLGKAADPDTLRKRLHSGKYTAVFITHVDTSSSVINSIPELVEECNKADVFSVVDSVCALGGIPLDFDKVRADIVFTASQKAIAGPPGGALIAVSQRAIEYMQKRKHPIESYYANLLRWKPVMEDPKVYFSTPATQILMAVREAMIELKAEGLENRWARHRRLGEVAREKVRVLGQEFVAVEGHRADTVTSFWVKGEKAGDIQRTLEHDHGVVVARGLYGDKDRMIRIGHFGILQPAVLGEALDSMGSVMRTLEAVPGSVTVQESGKKR